MPAFAPRSQNSGAASSQGAFLSSLSRRTTFEIRLQAVGPTEFFPVFLHGRKGRAQLVRLIADTDGSALKCCRNPDDGYTFCHERLEALVLFGRPNPHLNGHTIVGNTVTSQHQITAKLAKRKMLTCFTFLLTGSFRPSCGGVGNRFQGRLSRLLGWRGRTLFL